MIKSNMHCPVCLAGHDRMKYKECAGRGKSFWHCYKCNTSCFFHPSASAVFFAFLELIRPGTPARNIKIADCLAVAHICKICETSILVVKDAKNKRGKDTNIVVKCKRCRYTFFVKRYYLHQFLL
jgi:hypothetical protein